MGATSVDVVAVEVTSMIAVVVERISTTVDVASAVDTSPKELLCARLETRLSEDCCVVLGLQGLATVPVMNKMLATRPGKIFVQRIMGTIDLEKRKQMKNRKECGGKGESQEQEIHGSKSLL
jgi:hypothetical protein